MYRDYHFKDRYDAMLALSTFSAVLRNASFYILFKLHEFYLLFFHECNQLTS